MSDPTQEQPVTPPPPADAPETKPEDLPPADPDALARETTPVADSLQANPAAEAEKSDPPAEEDPTASAPATAKSYQVDVQRALARETQDGKGEEDPGPSDWQGYATEGVEVDQEASQ
jgi:hypothetical protein